MPRIFDNIENKLLPTLRETLNVADHADFCVGYFNLRGWREVAGKIDVLAGSPVIEDRGEVYRRLVLD